MNANKLMAPVMAAGVLLAGCGESGQTANAASGTQVSHRAPDGEPYAEAKYYPNGTRELSFNREGGDWPYYPSILQFCFDSKTVESVTQTTGNGVGGGAFTPVETACLDHRLTPDDNLPVPGQ